MLQLFSAVLDRTLFILTGNNDIKESLDDFEILPDLTTDHRGSCPLGSIKFQVSDRCPLGYLFKVILNLFKRWHTNDLQKKKNPT